MKPLGSIAAAALPAFAMAALCCFPAAAQTPIPVVVPIILDTAVPIVVKTIKPKTSNGLAKFEGAVLHANIAEITVRDKNNDLAIRTFPLSEAASAKMQKTIDKGGYQYGDKVTILYDPSTTKAFKVKGKPSRPL
jgi:hypothetical protein